MRLAFVLSSFQLSGGVMLVAEYANRLSQRGHVISLVIPAGTLDPAMAAMLMPAVQVVESRSSLAGSRSPAGWLRLATSLAQAIPPVDTIIATHTPTVVPTLWAARRRQTACAWLYMDYDAMFDRRPIERYLLHAAPRWFDVVMTISEPLAVTVYRDRPRRVVVTGSGLCRAGLFINQPRLPRQDQDRRVFYVGDQRPRKGLQEFLDAAQKVHTSVPKLRLVVASKQLLTLETPVPCEVHIHPSDQRLSELYRSSDLFVSASWGEGLGYPPLEAMACGTPVVLTDSEGVRDYAQPEENCLMVPPRHAPELAGAMHRVLTDPVLAQRLVAGGAVTVTRYDWETVADRVEAALA